MNSVLTIGLSPTFQKQIVFSSFKENEVNRSNIHRQVCSGKAINVSRVLRDLGYQSVNITQLGGPRVEEFLSLCKAESINVKHILVDSEIRTCVTIINEEKNTSTELVEEAQKVDEGASDRLYKLFLQEIDNHSAVVISGTKAEGFSSTLFPSIIEKCNEKAILTVLDIKGEDLKASLKARPSIIKPNLCEFCFTFGLGNNILENNTNDEMKKKVEEITRDIYSKYGTKSVITRGKYDTWVYDGNSFFSVQNKPIKVFNTIGCGDTLTGALTYSILEGKTLKDAVAFGMKCAQKKATHLSHGLK